MGNWGAEPDSVLVRGTGSGVLLIVPSGGRTALGDTEKFLVNGMTARPIVAPYILGVNNDANKSAFVLKYDVSSGFMPASTFQTTNDLTVTTSACSTSTPPRRTSTPPACRAQPALVVNGQTIAGSGVLQIGQGRWHGDQPGSQRRHDQRPAELPHQPGGDLHLRGQCHHFRRHQRQWAADGVGPGHADPFGQQRCGDLPPEHRQRQGAAARRPRPCRTRAW